MTVRGADRQGDFWVMRLWRAARQLSSRTSLRTKLVTTLLALVITALAAMACVGLSLLRGQLIGSLDSNIQQQASNDLANCAQQVATQNSGFCRVYFELYWITPSGQVTAIPTYMSANLGGFMHTEEIPSPPSLTSGVASWLTGTSHQGITVPAESGGGRWRLIGFPAYDPGTGDRLGTMVIGENATSAYSTLRELTGVDLIVSTVIVVVLAIVGFAVVQANLRPLVDIEETAGEIAEGHLDRRVPERDPRTEIGRLGRSLNLMLSQIEAAFHAREESEAAAHQSEERMRRFIADASHELRTPLTAIRGFAEYYRQRGGLVRRWDKDQPTAPDPGDGQTNGLLPDDLDRIMQRLEKEAARMGLLVEDLLLLARMDQQRPLARQPIDLLSLAADAVHDARLLAPARTIELSVQRGAAFLVTGDEPRLRQVIGNLMSNALTHTPDGTPIEVLIGSGTLDPRVPGSPAAVTLDVTDHGPGMSTEQAQRVFERFYRADQARTRATGGSGLGLAIVNALVVAHGGVASVRTAPDRGATFRIALPLAPEAQGGMGDDDDLDEPDEAPDAPGTPDHAWAAGGSTGEDTVTFGGKG
ncbi:MAG TPA: HAMP domain-containing sensor histidine kinase [Streptosporangiaceae bacterium]|nr:HAMP domain-containing sensor histidine kinase [Streptosporangiaceae bacterium]